MASSFSIARRTQITVSAALSTAGLRPNHRQKRLLHQIVGPFLARQPPPEEAVERPLIADKQHLERGPRPALEFQHQGFIAGHLASSPSILSCLYL